MIIMPMTSVTLRPGVNTQLTQTLNEAGVSQSNLIRYKDGLIQKIGGWDQYTPVSFTSIIRDLHAWQGATDGSFYLGIGATQELGIQNAGSVSDVTPQTRLSSGATFSISSGSNIVTVNDPGSSASTYDTVFFNTQVALGTTFLQGAYKIQSVGGSSSYTIFSSEASNTTVTSSGLLPQFTTTAGSATVTVSLPNNNYPVITGLFQNYIAPTSVGGLTIQGKYQTQSILTSTSYTINSQIQASSAATVVMNNNVAQLLYYVSFGPPPAGAGYGLGGYGLGGYGLGSAAAGAAGTPITTTDWTMDNWGQVLIACPHDGPIYTWSPDGGFSQASVIPTAPFFNGGIFISMPQQILVAWKSCQSSGAQDALIVRWSDAGDYTNWTVSGQTAAGSFTIPTGSVIVGGLQASAYGVIWTDIDVWVMQYIGGDLIFNFTRVGDGCGLIGPHAAGKIAGDVYWCGKSNFFHLGSGGVQPLPCTVWDFIFQNLDQTNASKIVCAPNSTFNEIAWFFPSIGGTGENDSYVKYNIIEKEWDYGTLGRNAWVDVTVLGSPLGADTMTVYQHETSFNDNGLPINASFQSGYWSIADGNELAFVDWFLPDMRFGTFGSSASASVQVTINALNYPGDTPTTYGPVTFTSSTQYLSPRLRGRLLSVDIQSNDLNSFWRIGRCRYRYATSGRR